MGAALPSLRFRAVSKRFRTAARDVWALRELDLCCEPGRLTCVLGPSGCGKTTLLRLAAGLDQPTAGEVLLDGADARVPGRLGLVSQEGGLFPWRTALANVALGLEIQALPRRERLARARRTLRAVGLPLETERCFPHELSGGMRQRVVLARALCPDPKVLLMDEPFASLDEPTRHRLQEQLLALCADRARTVLFVTHSIDEALFLADRIVVLAAGRRIDQFPVELCRPRSRLAADFSGLLLRVRRLIEAGAT